MSETLKIQSQIDWIKKTIPPQVRMIAVSKYVTEREIREAYGAGLRDFGESRIQDAQVKIKALRDLPDITWHLIGHLQSNKAKLALELFDWIHSVDSLKLAIKLDRLATTLSLSPNVCLQVKVRPDPTKFGWNVNELESDWSSLCKLEHINIKGLMSILPQGLSESESLAAFKETQILAHSIGSDPKTSIKLSELSMGMSKDYLLAISAGATMVRLGRILFPSLSR